MFYAASRGHQKVVDVLRRYGAQYQIWDAIFLGDDQSLDQMLSTAKGTAQFQEQLQHALGIAASQNNIVAARRLLKLGGDPYDRGDSNLSAYDLALSEKNAELVAEFEAYRKSVSTPSI
jgi:ankyrin repeat protein